MAWEEVILRAGGVEMERVGITCVRGSALKQRQERNIVVFKK